MSKSCPTCGRTMEEGFAVDAAGHSTFTVGSWHRGRPQQKWWGLKTIKADRLCVVSWRCTGCGLLENYAHKPA